MSDHVASAPARCEPDAETLNAVRTFLARLEGRYSVISVLLYGSRARGTHDADSDADLSVILKGEKGDCKSALIDMAGAALEVVLETNVLVEAPPLVEAEIEKPSTFSNPSLIANMQRDGLPV